LFLGWFYKIWLTKILDQNPSVFSGRKDRLFMRKKICFEIIFFLDSNLKIIQGELNSPTPPDLLFKLILFFSSWTMKLYNDIIHFIDQVMVEWKLDKKCFREKRQKKIWNFKIKSLKTLVFHFLWSSQDAENSFFCKRSKLIFKKIKMPREFSSINPRKEMAKSKKETWRKNFLDRFEFSNSLTEFNNLKKFLSLLFLCFKGKKVNTQHFTKEFC